MRIDLVAKNSGSVTQSSSGHVLDDFDLFELLGLSILPEEAKKQFFLQIYEQIIRAVFVRLSSEGIMSKDRLEKLVEEIEIDGSIVEIEESLAAEFPQIMEYLKEEMNEYKMRAFQFQLSASNSDAATNLSKALENNNREEFIKLYDLYSLERQKETSSGN